MNLEIPAKGGQRNKPVPVGILLSGEDLKFRDDHSVASFISWDELRPPATLSDDHSGDIYIGRNSFGNLLARSKKRRASPS